MFASGTSAAEGPERAVSMLACLRLFRKVAFVFLLRAPTAQNPSEGCASVGGGGASVDLRSSLRWRCSSSLEQTPGCFDCG